MLSSRTGPPLRVVPHGLFSWLALCSSHLLLFSLQVSPFLPGHRATMSSSAYASAFRTRLKIPSISLRNSWDLLGRRALQHETLALLGLRSEEHTSELQSRQYLVC